jgi:serine/threonine-protein kinase
VSEPPSKLDQESEAPAEPEPARTIGKYRVLDKLGEGGMGTVYLAQDPVLQRLVAIKVLHPDFATNALIRSRFLKEGMAAVRAGHPNIITVYDQGEDPESGTAYLVMELLKGETLRSFLQARPRLSLEQTLDIMLPVISAVSAAHTLDIVHRDLKPENIFLQETPFERRHPKVLDFGIAKTENEPGAVNPTGTGAMLGTPGYMAPEQIGNARKADARADQFSIGAILYECVTGRQVFLGRNPLTHAFMGTFDPPRKHASKLPEEMERLIVRLLSPDPKDRFPSVAALGRELIRFARPPTQTLYRDHFNPARVWATTGHDEGHADSSENARSPEGKGERISAVVQPTSRTLDGEANDKGRSSPEARVSRAKVVAPTARKAALGAVGIATVGLGFFWLRASRLAETNAPRLDVARETTAAPSAGTPAPDVPARSGVPSQPPLDDGDRHAIGASSVVKIHLKIEPAEARIEIDGLGTDRNPIELPRSAEEHRLVATAPGFRTGSKTFRAQVDGSTLELHLQPVTPSPAAPGPGFAAKRQGAPSPATSAPPTLEKRANDLREK